MSPRRAGRRRKPAGKSARKPRRRSSGRGAKRRSLAGTLWLFAGVALLAAVGVGVVHEESPREAEPPRAIVWNGARVRVDVQNWGEVTGMASAATDILRAAGFDVVRFGNAPSYDHDRPSAVIDRVGRTDQAQAVAKALGIDNVLSEPDPNLYVDVTVVVGRAWNPALRDSRSQGSTVWSWWDPRDWFGG